MKVKELRKKLRSYNPESEVDVIANNKRQTFSITYGEGKEGETKQSCRRVSIYVDDTNQAETGG